MQLSLFDNLLWGFGTALKLLLCFLVFYRGLHRRLPFFALYTVLLVAEAAILVALLAFGLRYRVALGSVERNIALGLGVYSAFQVVNNIFVEQWISKYFHWWNSMRVVSFEIAMLLWIIPLRNPLLASGPSPVLPKPVLIDEQVATSILRQLLDHMRAVRDEVKRLAKSFWR